MPKKKSILAGRAWNLLRLALLWTRKGGVFKRRLIVDLRLLPKHLKNLRHTNTTRHNYGERQLSFDETPIFHFKMNRPASTRFHIPCINYPQVDFDFEFDGNDEDGNRYQQEGRKSFLEDYESKMVLQCEEEEEEEEEEGIDVKADQFIAKFYEQMKLQRQVSYLQYNEMLNRGTS